MMTTTANDGGGWWGGGGGNSVVATCCEWWPGYGSLSSTVQHTFKNTFVAFVMQIRCGVGGFCCCFYTYHKQKHEELQ